VSVEATDRLRHDGRVDRSIHVDNKATAILNIEPDRAHPVVHDEDARLAWVPVEVIDGHRAGSLVHGSGE
jgi:hypothetical protein